MLVLATHPSAHLKLRNELAATIGSISWSPPAWRHGA
jgi:hypothetical protein